MTRYQTLAKVKDDLQPIEEKLEISSEEEEKIAIQPEQIIEEESKQGPSIKDLEDRLNAVISGHK